jgi:hypothetical protein
MGLQTSMTMIVVVWATITSSHVDVVPSCLSGMTLCVKYVLWCRQRYRWREYRNTMVYLVVFVVCGRNVARSPLVVGRSDDQHSCGLTSCELVCRVCRPASRGTSVLSLVTVTALLRSVAAKLYVGLPRVYCVVILGLSLQYHHGGVILIVWCYLEADITGYW